MSRVVLIAFLLHLGACSGLKNLPKLKIPSPQSASDTANPNPSNTPNPKPSNTPNPKPSNTPNPNRSTIETIYYKDGRLVNIVRCEGASWLSCYSEAGKVCNESGYDILEKNLSKQPSFFFGDKDIKELYFVCKEIAQDPPIK